MTQFTPPTSKVRSRRRGSIYVLVLSMSVLVCVIGLGALSWARAQMRIGNGQTDFSSARLCARAGLEMAMFRIQSDPQWRTTLSNGNWFTNVPLGRGAYSVSAVDPVTGDITVASNHPVVLTCTGTCGAATYQMQVQAQVNANSLGCVATAACSGSDIILSNCTLSSNGLVSSNHNVSVNAGSVMNANVQATGTIGGGGSYAMSSTTLLQPVALPDPAHVFDYYTANATAIPYSALFQSNATELLANETFDTNIAGWYVLSPSLSGARLVQSTNQHKDGPACLLVTGRGGPGDVPAQDLNPLSIRNGDTYAINVPVYANSGGNVQATIVIQSSTGTQSFSTPALTLRNGSGGWLTVAGNVVLNWTGTLTKATFTLTCTDNTCDIYIDSLSLTDKSLPSSAYVMDRVVLSPASNPYGATNAKGIYLIDCASNNVTIGPCRIVGTLILLNAGAGSVIQGPITWEPAVAGYPLLLTNSSIGISADASVGLSESTFGVNLNPDGTPYPYVGGTTNANASDGFPTTMNGLIYCGGDLTLTGAPSFTGCLIAAGKIVGNGPSARINYGNGSYIAPPPGFGTTTPAVYALPGSWQRVVH